MISTVLGLGANRGDPVATFGGALDRLADHGRIGAASELWRTCPVGPSQPDYSNAAVLFEWSGSPASLLALCREIETAEGRDRSTEERWGPRTLDIDLLMVRDLVWRSPTLVLPHPRLHERPFALVPAAEVAPRWLHPLLGRTVGELAETARRAQPDALISSEIWTATSS